MSNVNSDNSLANGIFEALRAMLPEASFSTWFSNASVEEYSETRLVIGAANRFVKAWLENNYAQTIAKAAESITGKLPEVEIIVSRQKYREQLTSATPAPAPEQPAVEVKPESSKPLFARSNHTFSNFTSGRCNQFAFAAAKQAVENPAEYSPLFIFGDHGLGKTHLLHAICHEVSTNNPKYKVICITPDYFVQSYTAAYINNRLPEFKKRYESCDLLAIDDFQNFTHGKKTASQKELVSILDNMQHRNRQVVISATSAVHSLNGLDPMLASRLSSGLQARLDALDDVTRKAIIMEKGEGISLEVASFISAEAGGSVRELEGIVKTVNAMNKISGMAADTETVRELISPKNIEKPGIELISKTVSEVFQIPLSDIRGKKRQGSIGQARRVAIHLSRQLSQNSLNEIGYYFGSRKHSTIITILKNGIGTKNPVFCNKLKEVLSRLGQNVKVDDLFKVQNEIF